MLTAANIEYYSYYKSRICVNIDVIVLFYVDNLMHMENRNMNFFPLQYESNNLIGNKLCCSNISAAIILKSKSIYGCDEYQHEHIRQISRMINDASNKQQQQTF